jgi:hypothetical protein
MTGHAHSGCYATALGDCGSKLTREHYVSESLLNELNRDNNLRVAGFPWQTAGQEKVLRPNALASKILCKRHNDALSSLDAIALRLFHAFNEEGTSGSGRQLLFLFNGSDLERWILKVLCGLAHSGNLMRRGGTAVSIPNQWLEILFGYIDFPDGQGLYVCASPGHRFEGPHGLELRAILGGGGLSGLGLSVCGYELILSMSGFPSRSFDGRTVVYRPLEFYTTGPAFEKSVVFTWQGVADLGTICLDIRGT